MTVFKLQTRMMCICTDSAITAIYDCKVVSSCGLRGVTCRLPRLRLYNDSSCSQVLFDCYASLSCKSALHNTPCILTLHVNYRFHVLGYISIYGSNLELNVSRGNNIIPQPSNELSTSFVRFLKIFNRRKLRGVLSDFIALPL